MSQIDKRLERIIRNPKNVSYEEIEALLTHFGFVKRSQRGSHVFFTHENLNGIDEYVNIPRHKPVKQRYVLRAIQMIELLRETSKKK